VRKRLKKHTPSNPSNATRAPCDCEAPYRAAPVEEADLDAVLAHLQQARRITTEPRRAAAGG
jgi:hypothetical protein